MSSEITVEQLTEALRAETPQADPAFAAALDERVAQRFPRRRRMPRPRTLAIGGGLVTAAAAVAAAIAIVSPSGTPETGASSAAPAQHEPPLTLMAPQTGGALAQGQARRVERSAELTLAAPDDRLQDVAGDVVSVTGRHHGFVQHEDVSTGQPSAGGTLELRVPVSELDPTL